MTSYLRPSISQKWYICLLGFVALAVSACQKPAQSDLHKQVDAEHRFPAIADSKLELFGKRELTMEDEKFRPIAYYRSYPKEVQRLLQLSDLESNQCKGGPGNARATLRACNRNAILRVKIHRLGWCYTSLEHSGASDHWMGCGEKGEIKPELTASPNWFFNEADFSEADQEPPTKIPCHITQPYLPPVGSPLAARFDIFGKPQFSADDKKINPTVEYQIFPPTIRRMLRHHDIEMGKCFGFGDAVSTLRACNRRNRLLAQIEARGWCWGSQDHISSTEHWMECSDIADYSPDQPMADNVLFDFEDMRKAVANEKARCL